MEQPNEKPPMSPEELEKLKRAAEKAREAVEQNSQIEEAQVNHNQVVQETPKPEIKQVEKQVAPVEAKPVEEPPSIVEEKTEKVVQETIDQTEDLQAEGMTEPVEVNKEEEFEPTPNVELIEESTEEAPEKKDSPQETTEAQDTENNQNLEQPEDTHTGETTDAEVSPTETDNSGVENPEEVNHDQTPEHNPESMQTETQPVQTVNVQEKPETTPVQEVNNNQEPGNVSENMNQTSAAVQEQPPVGITPPVESVQNQPQSKSEVTPQGDQSETKESLESSSELQPTQITEQTKPMVQVTEAVTQQPAPVQQTEQEVVQQATPDAINTVQEIKQEAPAQVVEQQKAVETQPVSSTPSNLERPKKEVDKNLPPLSPNETPNQPATESQPKTMQGAAMPAPVSMSQSGSGGGIGKPEGTGTLNPSGEPSNSQEKNQTQDGDSISSILGIIGLALVLGAVVVIIFFSFLTMPDEGTIFFNIREALTSLF